MKIRFQADADRNEEILAGAMRREPDIDFQTAEEANLRGLPDPEVLALAARDGSILVTHDRRTMPGSPAHSDVLGWSCRVTLLNSLSRTTSRESF